MTHRSRYQLDAKADDLAARIQNREPLTPAEITNLRVALAHAASLPEMDSSEGENVARRCAAESLLRALGFSFANPPTRR